MIRDQCEVFSSLSVERREKFDAHKHGVSDFLISTEVSFQQESSPKKIATGLIKDDRLK